jgi:hypothetical protein
MVNFVLSRGNSRGRTTVGNHAIIGIDINVIKNFIFLFLSIILVYDGFTDDSAWKFLRI